MFHVEHMNLIVRGQSFGPGLNVSRGTFLVLPSVFGMFHVEHVRVESPSCSLRDGLLQNARCRPDQPGHTELHRIQDQSLRFHVRATPTVSRRFRRFAHQQRSSDTNQGSGMRGGVRRRPETPTRHNVPRTVRITAGEISHISFDDLYSVRQPQSTHEPNKKIGALCPTIDKGDDQIRATSSNDEPWVSAA
jgi:hypothetical protein